MHTLIKFSVSGLYLIKLSSDFVGGMNVCLCVLCPITSPSYHKGMLSGHSLKYYTSVSNSSFDWSKLIFYQVGSVHLKSKHYKK